jgi:hypothetical protein
MTHLRWPQILSIALRLRVSEALLRTGYPLESYSSDKSSRAVLEEFERIAEGQLAIAGRTHRSDRQAKAEGPAVDAYLLRVGNAFLKQAAPACTGSNLAKTLFDAIIVACGLTLCQTCSGASACRWTAESEVADAVRVSSDGDCIQTVHDLFRWSTQITEQAYKAAVVPVLHKPPELMTGHGERSKDLELAIDGSTYQGRTRQAPRSVRVTFDPEWFWVPDYLSLAYVLCHECVAHGWCGVDVEAPAAEKSKAFHDGWMDCIAAQILKRSLMGGQTNLPVPIFAREIWEQTESVRAIRFNGHRVPAAADVWTWISGRTAMQTLWRLLALAHNAELDPGQWEQASDESLDSLIAMSLRINASRISHDNRARFVQAMNHRYSRTSEGGRAEALAKAPQVFEYIDDYRVRPDEDLFVRRIIALG